MKKHLLISLLVILMIALVACGGDTAPAETNTTDTQQEETTTTEEVAEVAEEVEAADGPITLKMTAWDIATTPYWQAVIDAYEAQNPNVTVELLEISSAEYQDKVNIMLSGGDDTDIITVKDIPGYSAMLTRGQIDPLEDYIAADGLDLSVYSGAAEELTFEGSIYALPFRSDIWILYYNKDIFDAAGIDYPSDITWAEYDALARELTSGEGAEKVYGGHHHTWRSAVELAAFQDGENTAIATDYSFMKPIYDMVVAMQDDGIIMDYGSLKAGNVHYSGVFKNEQIAMLPMGSWFIGSMIAAENEGETDFAWGVAKFPVPEGVEPGTTAGTLTSLAINSNSANKDAAWDFIKFYSGPEGAKALAETGNLPAIRNAEVLEIFGSLDGVPAEASEALQTTTVRLELPMHPQVGAVEQILNEEHELIMTNSVSVDEGLASMTERVSEIVGSDVAEPEAMEQEAPEPENMEPVTLKMTAWDIATTPYWQAVIDAYEAQNPNVTVELLEISSAEYQDKVNIMLSGGDDTDIITVKDIPGYSAMLTRGQIDPLEDYIAADGLDLSVYSGAAEELTFEGSIYALPFRSDIWILYYNKDIFDAAGIDYPSDITWAEYDALARELTSGEGAEKVYGGHHHTWRSAVELAAFQDGENTAIATDYSFMKPIYDMVVAMQDDGIIMDYGSLKAGNVHYSGVFKNEQIAMLPMGSWFIGSMIAAENEGETDFNWGVAKFPVPEGVEPGTTAGTLTSLAINSNSANKDAAWDFIKFYSGPEGAKALAATGNLPAIRNAEVLEVFGSLDGVPAEAGEALQTTTVRLELPMHPQVGAVEQILNEEHELIMTNSVSVDEGLASMTERVSEALEQ